MTTPRIVVIGGSAGGVEPLLAITRTLPEDFPAPVCVVVHIPPHAESLLPSLISRGKRMPATAGRDGEPVQPGHIYVAPPDSHMLVRHGRIRLSKGPSENGLRPAIDPLFRSVADGYGPGAIGLVLSGSLDDGTAGLHAIKAAGGTAIVQEPEEALYPSMPRSALDNVAIDHVASYSDIAGLLSRLIEHPIAAWPADSEERQEIAMETDVAENGEDQDPTAAALGSSSGFACPDCHGVLWEIKDGELMRFRCRVGHAYLPESLAAAQSARLEEALWVAMRSLRESAALARRLSERAKARGIHTMIDVYRRRAEEANERASLIEGVLKKGTLAADSEQASRA